MEKMDFDFDVEAISSQQLCDGPQLPTPSPSILLQFCPKTQFSWIHKTEMLNLLLSEVPKQLQSYRIVFGECPTTAEKSLKTWCLAANRCILHFAFAKRKQSHSVSKTARRIVCGNAILDWISSDSLNRHHVDSEQTLCETGKCFDLRKMLGISGWQTHCIPSLHIFQGFTTEIVSGGTPHWCILLHPYLSAVMVVTTTGFVKTLLLCTTQHSGHRLPRIMVVGSETDPGARNPFLLVLVDSGLSWEP